MKFFPSSLAALAATGAVLALATVNVHAQDSDPEPRVVLEIRGLHYDAGSGIDVRVSARNTGEAPVDNPLADPLVSGFVLIDAGGKEYEPEDVGSREPALQPRRLAPGAYFGSVVDVATHFPQLATVGKYSLVYRGPGGESNPVKLNIIEPYRPESAYTAVIETGHGSLQIELYGDAAPLTVRNFVDLSRQGFYDGLTFHYVRPGDMIMGGDPRGDGSGGSGFAVPAEFNSRQHLAGTVGMVRTSDPNSASSQFYICLAPRPERDGRFTVFGQVVEGFETLQKLARVPTTGTDERPYFKPKEPLVIQSVTIVETPAEAEGEDATADENGDTAVDGDPPEDAS